MSKTTTTIGEVLTAASEVSSLGGNDRLLAFGSDGSLKKISQKDVNQTASFTTLAFSKGASGERWVRLGYFISNYGMVTASIMNDFNDNASSGSCFWACASDAGGSGTVPKVTVSAIGVGDVFKKIRTVSDPSARGNVYLDVHMTAGSNIVRCHLSNGIHFTPNYDLEEATIPTGWTASEVSLLGGGG